ncbi:MAG: ComEC/Rec2 family competence protein [Anaeroplasmataceae bacterium]
MTKRRKKKGINKVILIILIIIIIALIAFGVWSYLNASKAINNASVSITNLNSDGNTVKFDACVEGEKIDYYDIYLVDNKDNEVEVVKESNKFSQIISYEKKVSYSTEYKVRVKIYSPILFLYELVGDYDDEATITTDAKPVGEDDVTEVLYDDFQIHFMMLGNDKAGDSIYIKAGETDVLIDAGSRQASVDTTKEYINRYCKDGSLEYVIATHGDQDHIDGFTDTTSRKGIFSSYECKNIIDFEYSTKTTATYNKYKELRDTEVSNGANHYYASECWNEENGAKREYQLSNNVTMEVLYNKYYFEKSSDENNHSVSLMFTYTSQGTSKYFMFTGDLEKEGEEAMAEYYDGSTPEKTLPTVDLFKAGHHGSKTSSNDCLLDIIQPKMCVVSCCCGTDEYTENIDNQFPTQEFINRIAKWTDAVYVTTIYEELELLNNEINTTGYKPMNGNIIVSAGALGIGLSCSNNTTKLKDSEWFNTEIEINGEKRKMRVWPES